MKLTFDLLRRHARDLGAALGVALIAVVSVAAQTGSGTQSWSLPEHQGDFPRMLVGKSPTEVAASLDRGPQMETGRSPQWYLGQHRKMAQALGALQPGQPGRVDAFVVAVGLDSDPVFGRETREAGKVLERRYNAAGRTIVLAGTDGSGPSDLPNGSPESLAEALARIAELMQPEDVLVLYSTSHGGARIGLVYHDGDEGFGFISPARLKAMLDDLGIRNRLLILSACYSGQFVAALASDTTALFTAASADRPSFGCMSENDWTFFGDALINHAMRQPVPLADAVLEAQRMIARWESGAHLNASNPQTSIGAKVRQWLDPLEAQMPQSATDPVGKPATAALENMQH